MGTPTVAPMPAAVAEIVDRLRQERDTLPDRFLVDVALLIERFTENRYEDPIYGPLGFPPEWLELRLTSTELTQVVEALAEVMATVPHSASCAAWGLGKARSDRAVDHLVARLEVCWTSHDALAFDILIALGTFGEERAWPLIERVSLHGFGESREEARRMVESRRACARDRG